MLAAFSTFTAICRGVLRLHGSSVSPDDGEVLRSAARIAGFDPTSVLRVLEHRRGTRLMERDEVAGIMNGYVAAAERIAQFVDQLWRNADAHSRQLEEPGG